LPCFCCCLLLVLFFMMLALHLALLLFALCHESFIALC
jgi:hypothetical protein